MFEIKFRAYWEDTDFAGIVFFPNFFVYEQRAEEELFYTNKVEMTRIFDELQVIMPRVETFAQFKKSLRIGDEFFMRLRTSFKGEKTVRIDFEVVGIDGETNHATGYVTAVCVSRETQKSCPIPDEIRKIYALAEGENVEK